MAGLINDDRARTKRGSLKKEIISNTGSKTLPVFFCAKHDGTAPGDSAGQSSRALTRLTWHAGERADNTTFAGRIEN
jgi:hypothetical protein